jgi:hypothetical protein
MLNIRGMDVPEIRKLVNLGGLMAVLTYSLRGWRTVKTEKINLQLTKSEEILIMKS